MAGCRPSSSTPSPLRRTDPEFSQLRRLGRRGVYHFSRQTRYNSSTRRRLSTPGREQPPGVFLCAHEEGTGDACGAKEEGHMKVSASVKRRCDKCRIIRRRGVIMVICTDPRHKQKQG